MLLVLSFMNDAILATEKYSAESTNEHLKTECEYHMKHCTVVYCTYPPCFGAVMYANGRHHM